METGKTGKYFKYAIGEIVLVVIGILIAENLALALKGRFSRFELKTNYNYQSAHWHPFRG
ncbi:MAG: hypothetical protein CO117_06950 [Flavobacteriaceae bacterium CG_4_9_14_3_um_filter_33_16]|nr:MAG: hypothetical protein CO117_06950 [Flavobacteriaceae bacterium CG_4_9_14_3_um_filter_33_16]